jgi:hypothetical protein
LAAYGLDLALDLIVNSTLGAAIAGGEKNLEPPPLLLVPLTRWGCAAAGRWSRAVITSPRRGVIVGAEAGIEFHAIAPDCFNPARCRLPIFHRMSSDRQLGAGGEIAFADSVSHQYAGPFGLETPGGY